MHVKIGSAQKGSEEERMKDAKILGNKRFLQAFKSLWKCAVLRGRKEKTLSRSFAKSFLSF